MLLRLKCEAQNPKWGLAFRIQVFKYSGSEALNIYGNVL